MTDWREHNGGPQPVGDDVWVEVLYPGAAGASFWRAGSRMSIVWKGNKFKYNILNQHLIDAARLEGIRLGLEAAANETERMALLYSYGPERAVCHKASDQILSALNPDTIAREAVLDQLTSEAQADNMGYDKETAR